MDLKKIFNNFFGMLKLDEKSYKEALKGTFGTAAIIFLITSIIAPLLTLKAGIKAYIGAVVMMFIVLLVGNLISTAILHLFAMIFGGKGNFTKYFVGLSYLSLIGIINVIPFLGAILLPLLSIWAFVMAIFVTKIHYKVSVGKALTIVLIPYILIMVLALIMVFVAGVSLITNIGMMQ